MVYYDTRFPELPSFTVPTPKHPNPLIEALIRRIEKLEEKVKNLEEVTYSDGK